MLLSSQISKYSPDGGTDIATLVRRALAEVCTVPVLLIVTDFTQVVASNSGLVVDRKYPVCRKKITLY